MDKLNENIEAEELDNLDPEQCRALLNEICRRYMKEKLGREVSDDEFILPDEAILEFIENVKNLK